MTGRFRQALLEKGTMPKKFSVKSGDKSAAGGLTAKGVKRYRAANPGSKLKTAVTTKPSKLKKGSKSAKRRKSFCKRMGGMKKKLTSKKTSRDPNSRINKALRKWNCSTDVNPNALQQIAEMILSEGLSQAAKDLLANKKLQRGGGDPNVLAAIRRGKVEKEHARAAAEAREKARRELAAKIKDTFQARSTSNPGYIRSKDWEQSSTRGEGPMTQAGHEPETDAEKAARLKTTRGGARAKSIRTGANMAKAAKTPFGDDAYGEAGNVADRKIDKKDAAVQKIDQAMRNR